MGKHKPLFILTISISIFCTQVLGKPSSQETGQNITVSLTIGHSSNTSDNVREESAPASPLGDNQQNCGYSRVSICSAGACSEQFIPYCGEPSERSETTPETPGEPRTLIMLPITLPPAITLPSSITIPLPFPLTLLKKKARTGDDEDPIPPAGESCKVVDVSVCDSEGNICERQDPITICNTEQVIEDVVTKTCDGKCKQRSADGRCLLDPKCCQREFPEGRQFLRCLIEE